MIQAPKGTKDFYGRDAAEIRSLEEQFAAVAESFGFEEMKLPTFEYTELFQRGVGDATDIVQKEMYTFLDKGGRSLTLRPEGTAGAVRAFLENGLASQPSPLGFFYCQNNFRYERPQKGRYREFTQYGVELFGSFSPLADVELLSFLVAYFKQIGLPDYELHLNSIGCKSCRPLYHKELKEYLTTHSTDLCRDCQTRTAQNPLRVLDCKEARCHELLKDAPLPVNSLCADCLMHYNEVKRLLLHLDITFIENPKLVRGLDYYNRTVFEFHAKGIGAQSAICGGGRYDDLVEELGGPPTPAVGFAFGLERLRMELKQRGVEIPVPEHADLYVLSFKDTGAEALALARDLRQEGLSVKTDLMERSFKAQMKYANRIQAEYLLVLGEAEVASESFEIKKMATGETAKVERSRLVDYIYEGLDESL